MNKNVRNIAIGTVLLTSVAAYITYKFYKSKKNKSENRENIFERNYTVIGTHDFSKEEKSKVM